MRSVKRRSCVQRGGVAHGQAQVAVGQDDAGRRGNVAHAPAVRLEFQDAPAVVHRRGGHERAALEDGAVGAAAADVDVGDGGVVHL
jgi:hypothetical protein